MAVTTRSGRSPVAHSGPVPASVGAALPPSYPAIWTAVAAIPSGRVAAYGEVARRAGLPRRARLVAQALKAAPPELVLPWHRVIRADGRIAFEPGSSDFRRQRRLLRAEGARVGADGRVTAAMREPTHTPDLDEAVWGP